MFERSGGLVGANDRWGRERDDDNVSQCSEASWLLVMSEALHVPRK